MKTILIADDDPDVRESVKTILEKQGYNTLTAVDSDYCVKKVKVESPDLILLDIMMPGSGVKDVLDKVKDVKIAFMSVVWISSARKQGLCEPENVVDFIQKPFDANDLINRVQLILNE